MAPLKRRNSISGQFTARLIEMLEAPAYRSLSRSAHMVISRIEIELGHHGGNDNGKLPVTTEDFVEYGMHRSSVAPAIREAVALGFIRVTERGHGGNAEYRKPNLFRLTFAHGRETRSAPPTHEWRLIKTLEEAEQLARAARGAKDAFAVTQGERNWHNRQQKKQKTGTENSQTSVRKNRIEIGHAPVREIRTTASVQKPELPSISQDEAGPG